jgi:hypothetical protein
MADSIFEWKQEGKGTTDSRRICYKMDRGNEMRALFE